MVEGDAGCVVLGAGLAVVVDPPDAPPAGEGATVVVVAGSGGAVVVVDVVVVVGNTTFDGGGSTLPLNRLTTGNVPWYFAALVAGSMKRLKISEGNDPPETLRPRTSVIGRLLPSGKPIQTAVVSFGV